MTEYDYSPEGYRQFQRTQQRIAHWTADTAHAAHQFRSPFLPRSDVQDNEFYNPRSSSSSRSSRQHTPSPHRPHTSHGHHAHGYGHGPMPQRSHSSGAVQRVPAPGTFARSPLRSHTIPASVSPDDSISQVSSRRARSHSPPAHRHRDDRSRGHHRSSTTTYVVSPQPQYPSIGQQLVYAPPQPQPAAYVVYPGDRNVKVHAVYPEPVYAAPAQHAPHPGSLLTRIFGERGRRSRSASHSHSHSRSSRR